MQKYEIMMDTKEKMYGHYVYRIKALKDFADVKTGDIGGYISSEDNLSQLGDCWVYDNAAVCGSGLVTDDAQIRDAARVFDRAQVLGDAVVDGYAQVYGGATVMGHAWITDFGKVRGGSSIREHATIKGEAIITESSDIYGHAIIGDYAIIKEASQVLGYSCIRGLTVLDGKQIADNVVTEVPDGMRPPLTYEEVKKRCKTKSSNSQNKDTLRK